LPVLIYYFIVEGNKNIVLYKTLVRMAANTELLTGYGRDYWLNADQFNKLSEEDRMLCSEYYKIDPEKDLIIG
jgi:hypothetical protein